MDDTPRTVAADPTSRTTEVLLREISSLKEIVFSKIESIERSIDVAHDDLVRVPTDVQKAVQTLKDLHEAKIAANRDEFHSQCKASEEQSHLMRSIIETRLDGMDLAIRLLQDTADKFPARIDEKILGAREVLERDIQGLTETTNEKFLGVQKQFEERDVRTDTSRVSDKTAVDAALAAQEKSFSKQGETFSEGITKLETSITKQIDQMGALYRSAIEGLQAQFNDLKDRFNRGEGVTVGAEKQVVVQQGATKDNQWLIGLIVGIVIAVLVTAANILLRR